MFKKRNVSIVVDMVEEERKKGVEREVLWVGIWCRIYIKQKSEKTKHTHTQQLKERLTHRI